MKMNYVINKARFLNRFGKAWPSKRIDEKDELVGGSDQDYTAAKEWVSLFAHEIVLIQPVKRVQQAITTG